MIKGNFTVTGGSGAENDIVISGIHNGAVQNNVDLGENGTFTIGNVSIEDDEDLAAITEDGTIIVQTGGPCP